MELWREQYEIDWKPLPKKQADNADSEAPLEAGENESEDGLQDSKKLSKKERKALAKERKAKAKAKREEKKLRDALRAAAEEDENGSIDSSSSRPKEPTRKKLRDRIFEGIRRIQCFESILSSPHGKISLNVAGSGRIGIFNALAPLLTEKEKKKSKTKPSEFRDGVQAFDVQVDRKKWTHVALVCSKFPKDSVILYFDGTPMETLPFSAFNLPMKYIGDPMFSFHGSILDVRIWGKPRSTRDIKSNMHELISFETAAPDASTVSSQFRGIIFCTGFFTS